MSRARPRMLVAPLAFVLFTTAPRIAEAHGDAECGAACDVGQAMLVVVPAVFGAAALATDVGTLVHLARSGTVPTTWSLAGTLLWVPLTLGSTVAVVATSVGAASDEASAREGAPLALGLSITSLVLSAGSLALQIHALGRPRDTAALLRARDPAAVANPARLRWVGVAPWSAPQAGRWSGGLAATFTF